jgi:hypothetical protein
MLCGFRRLLFMRLSFVGGFWSNNVLLKRLFADFELTLLLLLLNKDHEANSTRVLRTQPRTVLTRSHSLYKTQTNEKERGWGFFFIQESTAGATRKFRI